MNVRWVLGALCRTRAALGWRRERLERKAERATSHFIPDLCIAEWVKEPDAGPDDAWPRQIAAIAQLRAELDRCEQALRAMAFGSPNLALSRMAGAMRDLERTSCELRHRLEEAKLSRIASSLDAFEEQFRRFSKPLSPSA